MCKRLSIALALLLAATAVAARADEAPGCAVSGVNVLTADNKGEMQIGCTGLTEAFAKQFADIMTRVLQNRLDPQMVLLKLDEVDRLQEEGVARTLDENQRQSILQNLNGKPAGQIAITAHPLVNDAAEYAKSLATPLLMLGWQIEGQQIRRAAPKQLDPVLGVALIVRDQSAAPPTALRLKAALGAARITAALVADPAMGVDATVLWIGRRSDYVPPEAAK